MKKNRFSHLLLLFFALLSGYLFGLAHSDEGSEKGNGSIRQSGYHYIDPLLECENNSDFTRNRYIPFEKEVEKKILDMIAENHSGVTLSLYLRNLNNGPWFGINNEAKYIPASLMKISLLMGYLKWQESEKDLLERKIPIIENTQTDPKIPPEVKLKIGELYSIRDILYHLIVYSDNHASITLFRYLPSEILERVNKNLDIPSTGENPGQYDLTVKEYASFFRILYNASYLSAENSEYALSLLSKSRFDAGLRRGVPDTVNIAHKFGEREYQNPDGTTLNQLHDCGVVYYPGYPYLLCIMSRGRVSLDELSSAIGDTSRIIYDTIDSQYSKP